MDVLLGPLLWLVTEVINLYIWVLLIAVIMSWLVNFGVVNGRNRFVYLVMDVCHRLTEPVLRPIRNLLPNMGGLDLSPVILILLLAFVQRVLAELAFKAGAL